MSNSDFGVPSAPVPPDSRQQGSSYTSAPQAAQGAPYAAMPNIVVNIPPQKKSKAPWIIFTIFALVIIIGFFVTVGSCATAFSGFTSSSSPITVGDTVAVIHLDGTIAASGSDYITPENVLDELTAAENDSNVKAIVLRVNSGGGTSASSEEITQYVKQCSKPVVVSVSDICASGAYMFTSQADYVYTNSSATVGSIGCIMTVYNAEELLQKLGIEVDAITSGEDKAAGSYYEALTEEQRAAFQTQVDLINQEFIDTVSQGRGLERETVAGLATGATWTGSQALDLGLVDAVGTYEDALSKAAGLGGISGGSYDVVSFDNDTSFGLSDLL